MLKDIIKKEILEHLLSSKFLLMFIICSVLILLSAFMGISGYLLDKKEHEASMAALREDFQALETARGQFTPETMRVYRPPQTLKTLVNGVSDAAGRMSRPNNMQESYLEESKYGNNPDLTVFGALDLEFIVRVVLSLFALLFTFDAISGERERGTLKMALANNVSRAQLLIGKAVGGYVSMMLPLLVPFLLGLVILSLYPGVVLTGSDWQRIGLIFTLFLLYLSVFFALGIFVSSLTARSTTSFFALLALWAALVMVVPDLSALAAAHIRPVPDASEISIQKGLVSHQIEQESIKAQLERPPQMPGISTKEQSLKRQEVQEQVVIEFAHKRNEAHARIDRDYQLRKEAQAGLAKNLSRISPAAGLTLGAASLAETGVDEYSRFVESARNYGMVFRDWYIKTNLQRRRELTDESGSPIGNLLTVQEALASMPEHEFVPESLELSLQRALPDFALMAAMTVLFFAGACVAFMRYDVR